MAIQFDITGDNTAFIRSMNEVRQQISSTKALADGLGQSGTGALNAISAAGEGTINTLNRIGAAAGLAFSVAGANAFLNKVMETRSYFQDIESSMKVFLGSEKKASEFTESLKEYAYYNMFDFADLASASKQMIAYGHNVESVIPRLDQLSNVARGTGASLGEMVDSYNRAKNIGYLDSRALMSWASRGLVVKDVLDEMGEKVKNNKVTFEQLNKVLDKVTGEGGMFHNLMAEQMENISAEQGQLEDTMDAMFDRIGKRYEGLIVKGYKAASEAAEGFPDIAEPILDYAAEGAEFIIEHYKEIATSVMRIVEAYGAYKAVLVVTNALSNVKKRYNFEQEIDGLDELIKGYKEYIGEKEKAANADLAEAVSKGKLTQKQAELIAAKREELNQIKIEKESVGLSEKMIAARTRKLDVDLQDKITTQQLTLAQGEEIQRRRENVIALEKEAEAKKQLLIQQNSLKRASLETESESIYKQSSTIEKDRDSDIRQFNAINDRIELLKQEGGHEEQILNLQKQKLEITKSLASENSVLKDNLIKQESIEQELQALMSEQAEMQTHYGEGGEQYESALDRELSLAKEIKIVREEALKDAQKAYQEATENSQKFQETLDKLKEGGGSDFEIESADLDLQNALIEENAAKKALDTAETESLAAAEKVKSVQTKVDNIEVQKNNVLTGTNTTIKIKDIVATQGLTAAEKIQMIQMSASSKVSKIFAVSLIQIKDAIKALGLAIMTNPIGIFMQAIMFALPWIIEWVSGTDDAADATEKYKNEAEEAASKANSLVASLKILNKESKAYKETADELQKLYEDYGIKLEKTKDAQGKEVVTTKELIKHHDELVDVLRQEAVERQKIKDLGDASKAKEDSNNEAGKELNDSLIDHGFKKSEVEFMKTLISEDDIRQLTDKYNALQEKFEEKKKQIGEDAAKVWKEQSAEFKILGNAVVEITERTDKYSEALGKTGEERERADKSITKYISSLIEAQRAEDAAREITEESAAAAYKAGNAANKHSLELRYSKMSARQLRTELENLVKYYKNTKLHINIDFSQTNVPGWMKKLDLKTIRKGAEEFGRIANEMQTGGEAFRMINGKKMSLQQVGELAYNYSSELVGREDKAAADEAAAKAAREEAERNADKNARDAAQRRQKRWEADQKLQDDLAKMAEERQKLREDIYLSSIEDDTTREIEKRRIENERKEREIKKMEEDFKKKNFEKAKEDFNINNKSKNTVFADTKTAKAGWQAQNLTQEQNEQIKAERELLNNEILKNERDIADALVESHQSYIDKKIKIDDDYESESKKIQDAIADAEKRGDKDTVEALKRSRAELEKERAKSQADLSLQQLQENPEYIRAFEDLDNTSTETLEHLIQMFEDAKKSAGRNLDPQDLKAYTDAIRQMQDKVRERDPFKALAESAKKLKKANGDVEKAEKDLENVRKGGFRMMTVYNKETKEYEQKVMSVADAEEKLREAKDKQKETHTEYSKNLKESIQNVSRLGSSISELGNTIGGTAGAILSLTGEVFSFVNNTITSIDDLNKMQKGLAKTIETASVVLMVISTAFQLFQKVSSLFGESEEEKRLRKERIKFYEEMTFKVAEYRKQVLLAEQAEKEWFSTTDLQKLTDQWQVSQQAVKDYKKAIEDVRDTYYESIKGSSLFDFIAGGDIYEKWKKWSNFGKDIPLDFVMNVNGTPDTLSHFVKETYGEALYGEDGLLNIDLANSVLNDYGDMLVENGKEILESLVAQLEEYNKWVESLREYVSNLYSPFADNMVDSLWEWYENGTDVMDAFGDKARDTFKAVSQEMMKQLVNSVVFDKLKERLTSAYEQYAIAINNGTDQKQALYSLTDTLENVMSLFELETKDAIPVLQTYMQRLGTMVGESFGGGMADSFDEMRDSFRSALLDMESDTDNFAKNIKQNIFEALVGNFYMEQMKDDINELAKAYDAVTKARYVDKNGNTYANDPREVLQTEVELLKEQQQSLTKNSAEWRDVTDKIIDYNKQIAAFEGLDKISDEERQRRIDDLNAEANAIIKVGEEAVKTYAAMTGWDIEQKIDASPFANLSDDMLSVLQDTSKSVDEWKDEIVKMMTDDLVKELVYNDEYKAKMREFQEQYVAIFENDALSTEQKQAQLDSLATSMAEYANKQADAVKDIVKANEELESSFGDLHDTFMDAITDMENGAEDLRTKLNETLIKDLIEKKAFEVPITVTIDGEEKVFENFDKYQEDWTRRYLDALDNYKETGDETTLNLLVDELTKREEAMAELTKDYVERLQKAAKDTTFTDMESSLVSALMNMNGDITDFANDMKKTIVQKLIESFMVSEQIKPMLEEIQRAFNYAMSQGMTSEQRAAFFKNGGLFTDETGTLDFKGIDSYNDKLTSMYDATTDLLTAIGYDFGEVETLFSKLGDTIVSSLGKTENGVEDFMTSITETIVNDLVKSYVASDELQERLTGIKDGLEAAAKAVAEAKTDEEIAKANEQLKEAKKNAEDFYNEVEAGTKRFTDLLNTVENDTTFSDLGKSFISSLTDMSKTAEDWAHDVGRTMAERIFEGMLEARNAQGIFDNIQKVFNEAVAANTDENGNIDWQKVVNTPALTETVNDSKKDFTELQTAWETLCESLGISLKELPLSDLGSTIMDSLTDLEDNADDFGKRISITLMQGMLEELFNERYTERLNEIREHWQKALAGEDGYTIDSVKKEVVDFRNELDNLSEDDPLKGLTDGIKELSKEVEEADKTFSDMADSFVSNLLDMESTAKDLGNSIGQTLIEKIVKALIVDKELQKFLDDIQEAFDTAIADQNATIDSVLDAVVPKIDAAVEATEKWEDVTKALAERYKQIEESTPFDDLRSKFRSSLMNMSEDVNAFSNDLTDAITEAFIDSFVLGTAFDDALDGWKERYGKIMGAEGLSEEERARQLKLLQSDIVEAKEGYIEQTRNIQDLLGYGTYQDQDATMNMADKATYDQFETYLGIAVAQQITGEQQLGIQQQILATLQGMSGLGTQTNDALLTQTMLANAHLELIRDYSKTIRDEVLLHLASMDSKLSHLTNI